MSIRIELTEESIRHILGVLASSVSIVPSASRPETEADGTAKIYQYTIGQQVKWAGYNWIVVHITSDRIYLASEHVLFSTPFGATAVYEDSVLIQLVSKFEHSLSLDVLEQATETTVEDVTGKIFVPTVKMISEFDWFKDLEHRTCGDTLGNPVFWWLATPFSASDVWLVSNGGDIDVYNPAGTIGFRPFVALHRGRVILK